MWNGCWMNFVEERGIRSFRYLFHLCMYVWVCVGLSSFVFSVLLPFPSNWLDSIGGEDLLNSRFEDENDDDDGNCSLSLRLLSFLLGGFGIGIWYYGMACLVHPVFVEKGIYFMMMEMRRDGCLFLLLFIPLDLVKDCCWGCIYILYFFLLCKLQWNDDDGWTWFLPTSLIV
jgi:hypothetical protein